MEKRIDELGQVQQYRSLYPAQGAKGPGRVATVLSQQFIPRHLLADSLGLDQLPSGSRGWSPPETISLLLSTSKRAAHFIGNKLPLARISHEEVAKGLVSWHNWFI
ncbi:MAG: hypothetical protein ACK532_00390 [Acidobacteriota bacterium]|jgi:hypothetical protein